MTICNAVDVPGAPIETFDGPEKDDGCTIPLMGRASSGAADLSVSIFRMEPRQFRPAHLHPGMGQLYFVLDGECEIRTNDSVTRVTPGTAIYTPRGTAHSLRTLESGVKALVVFPPCSLPLWLRVSWRCLSEQ